jgi:hypothetical protein
LGNTNLTISLPGRDTAAPRPAKPRHAIPELASGNRLAIGEAVSSAGSTLRDRLAERLWLPFRLLLSHPTSRQRNHHSPLLRTAQLLSKCEEMMRHAALGFRSGAGLP